jgi:tetratricopeptide (TPR) repeat protein
LPAEDKRLLQTASVIGHEVPYSVLQAIVARPAAALRRGLARLQQGEFLYERGLFPAPAYTFKHALTHEVAYGSLLQVSRRMLHARIVEATEAVYADQLTEHVERLAHHALRGELWDKAMTYCRQAGAKAGARSAYREAVVCLDQALEALKHLPESQPTIEQAIDLRCELRTALLPLGEVRRVHDLMREAEILAKAVDDQRRLGHISGRLCHTYWQMGDYELALAVGERALAISTTLGNVVLQFNTNLHLAYPCYTSGQYGRAVTFLRTNLVSLEGELPPQRLSPVGDNAVHCRALLSHCLAELGAFAEGITYGEEGIRIAERLDHPYSRASAYRGIGELYLCQGDLAKAIAVLERGIELCQVWQMQLFFPYVASPLGAAYALHGRVAEAMPLLEQAVEQAISVPFTTQISRSLTALSEAYLLAGRPDEAMALAQRAFEHTCQYRERGHEAYALRLLGEIAVHRNPPDVESAEAHYLQALAQAEELGMRPLQAHCRCGLGTLYAKMGRREQARAELCAAVALYRAMEMTFWLPQAEAVLAQAV